MAFAFLASSRKDCASHLMPELSGADSHTSPPATVGHRNRVIHYLRNLSLVVIALCVTMPSLLQPGTASAYHRGSVFSDVGPETLHGSAVEILEEMRILEDTGCDTDRFCSSQPVRRWVIAVWLVRAIDGEDPEVTEQSSPFTDVMEFWWLPHVNRLAELGISDGCSSEPLRYCPFGFVTRGQMATFLIRAFSLESTVSRTVSSITSNVHARSIAVLEDLYVTEGCRVEPLDYCTDVPVARGPMATFLARAMNLVPSAEFADEIRGLPIRHLVSSYTTYHLCCGNRVNNIQLFADKVSGAIVPPDSTFSLNGHVGKRTWAAGFLPAGTLIEGELVNTVGGGVSQFATTFYNAVYWGGYEDITHKAHSIYFRRYPEGIEATINWPDVDLVFRNDTAAHVLITTDYTPTSITVNFYGDNDGRILIGDWEDGSGRLDVVTEGGPAARHVTSEVSPRFDWTGPRRTLVRGNPDLGFDEQVRVQSPLSGWSVDVTRTIEQEGRTTVQEWLAEYTPRREIVEVHPCVLTDTCPRPEEPTDDDEQDEDGSEDDSSEDYDQDEDGSEEDSSEDDDQDPSDSGSEASTG